jgi:N,N-dimethylformamidase beta subunit-like protein/uncharacterized protein DUF4082/Big-like domain-containing protein
MMGVRRLRRVSPTRWTSITAIAVIASAFLVVVAPEQASASDPCAPPVKPIACENTKTGTSPSVWDIDGAGSDTIQGYSTDISVNVGGTIGFKINTSASSYTIDIYRMGYYNGNGARKIATVTPSVSLPQSQPACVTDPSTSLVDCGTWNVSASWTVPASAVSGIYFAKLTVPSTGASSHITFVVRDDSSHSDLVFKTSDATWQAYNTYGGWDFYSSAVGRAFKLSYNRPFATRGANGGRDFAFANEYPMIRFLERNGYDLSYTTDLDLDRNGSLLTNHKVFLSVGHDEYWSGPERTAVENARDAGVNLAFFSGNEVFWRTRWENSVDGHNIDHRTLVCYKETWENAKTDPTSEWTGTFRDPRFSPPANGGAHPENALTGNLFMSLNDDLTMQVPAAEGKDRLWRNTSVASLAPGTTATLAPHTVGYESDEDTDNGFRPAGLIDLSTTTGSTPGELLDYGNNTGPGTTTHHLTLYRAPSGALVFGAGTVQWAWGLDANHDTWFDTTDPPNAAMQQATINLFADMGVQPNTLMAGMVAASKSTDTTAPTVVITTPTAGATVANGSLVNVSGTAADVGGVVAGVEYSTDNGASWHPANGTTAWSFSYYASGDPTSTVQVRAIDDSVNIGTASMRTITVTGDTSLFGARVPGTPATTDASAVELGVKIVPQTDGYINGIRFYKGTGNTGTHVGSLWWAGTLLATGTFTGESASGWQTLTFSSGVAVTAGQTYIASYTAPAGHYAADQEFFVYSAYNNWPLSAPRSYDAGGNGVYGTPGHYPGSSYNATNYYVDVLFRTSTSTPPSVTSVSPVPGARYVPVTTQPTATFSKQINPATLQFTLKDPGNNTVAGTATYDSTSRTATFAPSANLTAGATYTASVQASDTNGNAMAAPKTWSFTTDPGNTTVYTLFAATATPATTSIADPNNVSVGVKFTPANDGQVIGIRFYKGVGNVGTHTGSLWSPAGALLATATFSSESDSGWQTVYFTDPVNVSAGTTYTASYYAPTGHYAGDSNFFASGYSNPPLSAPAGANGVYTYGSDTLPTNSYGSTNYWVDPLFVIPPPAPQPPTVPTVSPVPNALYQPVSVHPTATFSAAINTATLQFTLKDAGNNTVAGSVSYDATSNTATFTPSASLAAGASYTASVQATGTNGIAMPSPRTWSFTTDPGSTTVSTLFAANATPGSPSIDDPNNVSLGVKFTPSSNGTVIGVRFYKGAGNTGTHTGSLWSPTGTLLATATFTSETGSGWQTVYFASPVAVTAGSTYTASYYAPNGHYAADGGYFAGPYSNPPLSAPSGANGVYAYGSDTLPVNSYNSANYWVDPLFVAG